jgi:hypothetical protein
MGGRGKGIDELMELIKSIDRFSGRWKKTALFQTEWIARTHTRYEKEPIQ